MIENHISYINRVGAQTKVLVGTYEVISTEPPELRLIEQKTHKFYKRNETDKVIRSFVDKELTKRKK